MTCRPPAPRSADRVNVPLSGPWQVCRYDEVGDVVDRDGPTKTLPAPDEAFWTAINVPGDKFKERPDLDFAHRIVYRARVHVPADMAGRSFYLRLPSINLIASVIVNGQYCGWTKAMYALFECDMTKAIKPGQDNDVCVVLKDTYYAFSPKKTGKSCRFSWSIPATWLDRNYIGQSLDFPVGSHYGLQAGILEAPSLVVAGGVYSSDVFARPSVKDKALGLEITVLNPSASERTVQVANRDRAGRRRRRREEVRARAGHPPRRASRRCSTSPRHGRTRSSGGRTTRRCTTW